MAEIAFIGLGIMGRPMVANLLKAGHKVTVYSRTAKSTEDAVKAGATSAQSIEQAVAGVDFIITMVPDSADVEAVALGDAGIYAHAKKGALHIDCSSIRPGTSQSLYKIAKENGLRAIDAPVSGGEIGAIEGTLSIMVGGDGADVKEATPILEAMGKTIVHVGPSGSGQTVKAANQLIVAGTIQLVSESIVFLEAHGVDTEAAVKVLAGGLAGNAILNRKAEKMLKRDFTPGFRVELHHKDMGIVTSAAREAGVAIPVGALVAQLMGALKARGDGQLDHSALLKLTSELSGKE